MPWMGPVGTNQPTSKISRSCRRLLERNFAHRSSYPRLCLFLAYLSSCHREEAPGVLICWTVSPHPLRRFPFPRFRLLLEILSTSIYCLFGFHQAEISIVNRLVQGRCNVTRARYVAIPAAMKTAPLTTRPRSYIYTIMHTILVTSSIASALFYALM